MADYVIIAGINGAGKSTLYTTDFAKYIGKAAANRVNPDEEIVNFGGHFGCLSDQRKAGKISVTKIRKFLDEKIDFNQETTFSGSSEFAQIMRAKNQDFRIVMLYVGVSSSELAKSRVRIRVAKGGHDIPDEVVEKRYENSIINLKNLAHLIDDLHIFDNTAELKEVYWRRDKTVIIDETQSINWLEDFKETSNKQAFF
jgi:predicted ABC-type ATPase